ncbi:protein-glutamate O-methyltransferase CheR [Ancylobacter sp. FA202]|uniref:CheR family methyltransferase n=1 Tax=Ancylobacter sp. FA202 TaxID=1111106 RepID=UPI000366776E|nr:protein-glutamate O-methyltransferase CheR [Ancylobacter sp. FA202]
MIGPSDFEFLQRFLKDKSGLALGDDKRYLLETRLDPVMKKASVASITQLVATLRERGSSPLAEAVIEAMTTNESLFFRDKRPFDQLAALILPELISRRPPGQPLRIWCAAASTGQEPYSIAMLLRDNERLLGGRRVEIVATDLSAEVIERAQEGVYTQFEVQRGLPVHYLLKCFNQEGQMWRINADIRAMVRFSRLNLLQSFAHLGQFDIVFCRNVLIYFDAATKTDVLGRIANLMARDGYLVLGGAESVLGLSSELVPGSQHGFYIRKN